MPGTTHHPPHVLFLYGDRPSGHAAAAAALRDQMRLSAPHVRVSEFSLSELHPFVGPLVSGAYLQFVQKTPKLWSSLYDNSAVAAAIGEIRRPLSALHRKKLRARLRQLSPDLIVCTHALPCATLSLEKENGALSAPLAAVLTDYGVHAFWVSAYVDLYLASCQEAAEELMRRGVDGAKIQVTGIPVHPKHRERPGREQARSALGLALEPWTLLLEGGSRGLGPLHLLVDQLLAELPQAQLLIACGRNRGLYRELRGRYGRTPRVRPLPFTRRMPTCLAAADLLVGKPGGLTAAEATATGLPLVLVDPLPGQEQRNSAHLASQGAAICVEDASSLGKTLRALLQEPERLRALREGAKRASRPASSEQACRALLQLLP